MLYFNKILIIISVIFVLSQCSDRKRSNKYNRIQIDYHENGLTLVTITKNTDLNDTLLKRLQVDTIKTIKNKFSEKYFCLELLEDGKLNSKGLCDSLKIRVGIWNFYKDNKPFADVEYIDYLGKQILNRRWGYYKKDTDIFIDNSYYIAPEKDTLLINKWYRFNINVLYPRFSETSKVLLLLPRDSTGKPLKDKRFYELNYPVKFDTFENIETLRKKMRQKPQKYDNLKTAVDIEFQTKGKKVLSGILLEEYKKNDTTYYKELFFSKNYYVKDSVK